MYEQALVLEARIVELLDGAGSSGGTLSRGSKTPAPANKFRTPGTPASARASARKRGKANEGSLAEDEDGPEALVVGSARMQDAQAAKAIFEEAYLVWQALVETKGEEEARPAGLERFDCGRVRGVHPIHLG